MSDFQTEDSRMASRIQKRRQNRLLNLLIAIVVILILIVAYSMFSGGSHDADHATQTSANGPNHGGNGGSGAAAGNNSNHDQKNKDESNQNEGTADDQKQSSSDDQKQSTEEKKNTDEKKDKLSGGGPDGPWKPIGTKQQGSHVSSYQQGSTDWNEKVKALLYATGISKDNYVLWWLGNGGGPQQAVGKISSKDNKGEMYVVHLKWVENKGWKPTSVEKVSR